MVRETQRSNYLVWFMLYSRKQYHELSVVSGFRPHRCLNEEMLKFTLTMPKLFIKCVDCRFATIRDPGAFGLER